MYAGAVQQVVRGRLDGRELRMTVLASDQATEAFLASHAAPAVIEASFTRDRRDEPYQTRAFTGFVDDARTSWRLVHVE